MALIYDGIGGTNKATVDAVATALRASKYDPANNLFYKKDRNGSITPASTYGYPLVGSDYKNAQLLRAKGYGHLTNSNSHTLLFYDNNEGSAFNTNKWTNRSGINPVVANGTMTVTDTAGAGSAGWIQSLKAFTVPSGGALLFRGRYGFDAHNIGNYTSIGLAYRISGNTQTYPSYTGGGVAWKQLSTGHWVPIISFMPEASPADSSAVTEVVGTPIPYATFISTFTPGTATTAVYGIFEILLEQYRAVFSIYTSSGVLFNTQTIDLGGAGAWLTSNQMGAHVYQAQGNSILTNNVYQNAVSVHSIGFNTYKPWSASLSGQFDNSLLSPTAFTQLSNYANSTAPVSASLSNTAAGYTTLGGQWQFAAVAGAETDYALFAQQIPSPYTFYCTGIRIDGINTGAAVATTSTVLQWSAAFNSSAVSLATGGSYPPMVAPLGYMCWTVAGGAIGNPPSEPSIFWQPGTPVAVQPGRFIHIIVKCPIGTATASQILRGSVAIDGWFE